MDNSEIENVIQKLGRVKEIFRNLIKILPSFNITDEKILPYGLKPHTRSVSWIVEQVIVQQTKYNSNMKDKLVYLEVLEMCEQKLKDKVAIITGGAQGIGRAIAEKLADEGAKIVIVDVMEESAQKTADEIKQNKNVETTALKIDVSSSQQTEEMVKKTVEKFSKIDIIINNAGITRDNLLIRMSDEEWDKVLAINLKGVFNCSKAAAKIMMKQRSGKIVNIASVVGLMGNAGQSNYSASKGGVIALTKTLARELASRNINVNAVAPGFIKTVMTDKLSDEQKKKLTDLIPLSRLGEPQDVANVVTFLCSEEASYITGEIISVNGGMYM